MRRAGGRTGRAGGQHCDESGPNRLLSGHALRSVLAVGSSRDAEPTALTSGTKPVVVGVKPGSRPPPASRGHSCGPTDLPGTKPVEPGPGPHRNRATTSMVAAARVDRSGNRHPAGGIKGQALTTTTPRSSQRSYQVTPAGPTHDRRGQIAFRPATPAAHSVGVTRRSQAAASTTNGGTHHPDTEPIVVEVLGATSAARRRRTHLGQSTTPCTRSGCGSAGWNLPLVVGVRWWSVAGPERGRPSPHPRGRLGDHGATGRRSPPRRSMGGLRPGDGTRRPGVLHLHAVLGRRRADHHGAQNMVNLSRSPHTSE
jgi:hypothetical protein